MQHIFEAISEETKARGETRWLKMRPRHRSDAIWSQLHNLGYENEKNRKTKRAFIGCAASSSENSCPRFWIS